MGFEVGSTPKRAVWAAVSCVVVVTLLSGPLIAIVDLTEPHGGDFIVCEGGTASIDAIEVPVDELTLSQTTFGAESYALVGAPAIVDVDHVQGCPRLSYRLLIPALGIDARQVLFLESGQRGELTLTPPATRIAPTDLDGPVYDATVMIELDGDTNLVLYRANATVMVET